MLSPTIAPAQQQTRSRPRAEVAGSTARTPPVIATLSLGTTGKNASIIDTAKIDGYAPAHAPGDRSSVELIAKPRQCILAESRAWPGGSHDARHACSPLRGMRVVDVTSSLAGPTRPAARRARRRRRQGRAARHGDHARAWGPPFWNGEGAMFLASNAGKRSLALALRDPSGPRRCSASPTAPTSSFRACGPGSPEEHGLGPDVAPRDATRGSSTARSARSARRPARRASRATTR